MRPKSFVLLALALGCGLVASIGISQIMDKNRQQGGAGLETEAIYIAKLDINLGDPIKPDLVSLEEWPKDKIPAGAIRELSELEDYRPRTKIFAGEPILEGKLLNKGEDVDATMSITPGLRVLPISVKAETGGAGLLKPGDRVDVQWFVPRNQSLGVENTTTKTIMHNIRVFAVDQTIRRLADGEETATLAKTVSLLVTPKQANMLRMADKVGEISLVARNPDDVGSGNAADVDFEDLLAGNEKSSRAKEQGRDEKDVEKDKGGGFFGLLLSGLKARAAGNAMQHSKPFRMEVITGDEVEVLQFNSSTGYPLTEEELSFANAGFGGPAMDGDTGFQPPSTTGGNENDFPIELEDED